MLLNSLLISFHLMDGSLELLLFQYVLSDDNLEEIRELLHLGVDPNYQMISGTTPLHAAAVSRKINIEAVQELIRCGAEVNFNDHLSYTALHYAVIKHKQIVVNELLQAGALVNAKNFFGETPLHFAVRRFSNESSTILDPDPWIIKYLLEHEDIDCNARDFWGNTPLMVAIIDKQVEAAKHLLDKNADPNICNNVSESPLHVAFSLPPSSIEVELLLRGASIYSEDKKGQTPLDIFVKYGLGSRTNEWIILILKVVSFKYSITSDLKRKLELIPQLSQFFNKCCDQVDYMRVDFISGNITMHDFCWDRFDENDFKFLLLQIHKPVVERLVSDIYSEYFIEILDMIPKFSLYSILQMTACSKRRGKAKGKVKDLADMFSMLDVIYLFSKYLSNVDIFCLIVAFSDVIVDESLQNVHDRHICHIFDQN